MLALVLEIAHAHPDGGADADEAIEHSGDQRPVAQRQEPAGRRFRVEECEQPPRSSRAEDRRLALTHDEALGADRAGRVVDEHSALGQEVEPVPDRRGRELDAARESPSPPSRSPAR